MKNVSAKRCIEKQNTYFVFNNFFFENRAVCDNVGQKIWYSRSDHRWQKNTSHAHSMLDTYDYKHTLRICNSYCFFPRQQWLHGSNSIFHYTYI